MSMSGANRLFESRGRPEQRFNVLYLLMVSPKTELELELCLPDIHLVATLVHYTRFIFSVCTLENVYDTEILQLPQHMAW